MVEAGPKELDQAHAEKIKSLENKFVQVAEQLTRKENEVYAPIYKERSEFLNEIDNFWLQVFANFPALGVYLHNEDLELLSHLKDISIETSSEDLRIQTISFKFSPNKYFSNETLTKTFIPKSGAPEKFNEYSLMDDSESEKTKIDWYSEDKNLVLKFPTKGKEPFEDDFDPGSFFSVFFQAEKGLGLDSSIADMLIEHVHPNAVEIYKGEYDDGMGEEDADLDELEALAAAGPSFTIRHGGSGCCSSH